MASSQETRLARPIEIFRDLSGKQGAATRDYGDLLVQFGESRIGAADLLKASGDLYIAQSSRVLSIYFNAGVELVEWGLKSIGARRLTQQTEKKVLFRSQKKVAVKRKKAA